MLLSSSLVCPMRGCSCELQVTTRWSHAVKTGTHNLWKRYSYRGCAAADFSYCDGVIIQNCPYQGHLLPVHSAQPVRLVSRQVLQAQCEDSHAPHAILMV